MRYALFAIALVALVPLASADEALADCETDQPWIGYRTTDPARALVQPLLADAGLGFSACEGEQWDGQDPVTPAAPSSCAAPSTSWDPAAPFATFCLGADPNAARGDDPLAPVGARISAADLREAYVALNVAFVARSAVYVGTCGSGEAGLEDAAECAGSRELRAGVYVRDNTPGNVIAQIVSCTRGAYCDYVWEADCSYATYVHGAYDPPTQCTRDNTALGFELVLP